MKRTIFSGLIAAALLALLLAPMTPVVWAQISNFDNIVTSADMVVGDDMTIGDDAVVGGLLRTSAAAAVTVTRGGTITPTGSYQPITATKASGTSGIAILSAGTVVRFVNTSANTITLTDTGTLKLSGNAALGQFDTLTVLSDGTNWIEVGETNN